jgi:hypothetical protein
MLRAAFIMCALDAGVPLRDVQIAARHADPRTTTVYDHRRQNLDSTPPTSSSPSSPEADTGTVHTTPGARTSPPSVPPP